MVRNVGDGVWVGEWIVWGGWWGFVLVVRGVKVVECRWDIEGVGVSVWER